MSSEHSRAGGADGEGLRDRGAEELRDGNAVASGRGAEGLRACGRVGLCLLLGSAAAVVLSGRGAEQLRWQGAERLSGLYGAEGLSGQGAEGLRKRVVLLDLIGRGNEDLGLSAQETGDQQFSSAQSQLAALRKQLDKTAVDLQAPEDSSSAESSLAFDDGEAQAGSMRMQRLKAEDERTGPTGSHTREGAENEGSRVERLGLGRPGGNRDQDRRVDSPEMHSGSQRLRAEGEARTKAQIRAWGSGGRPKTVTHRAPEAESSLVVSSSRPKSLSTTDASLDHSFSAVEKDLKVAERLSGPHRSTSQGAKHLTRSAKAKKTSLSDFRGYQPEDDFPPAPKESVPGYSTRLSSPPGVKDRIYAITQAGYDVPEQVLLPPKKDVIPRARFAPASLQPPMEGRPSQSVGTEGAHFSSRSQPASPLGSGVYAAVQPAEPSGGGMTAFQANMLKSLLGGSLVPQQSRLQGNNQPGMLPDGGARTEGVHSPSNVGKSSSQLVQQQLKDQKEDLEAFATVNKVATDATGVLSQAKSVLSSVTDLLRKGREADLKAKEPAAWNNLKEKAAVLQQLTDQGFAPHSLTPADGKKRGVISPKPRSKQSHLTFQGSKVAEHLRSAEGHTESLQSAPTDGRDSTPHDVKGQAVGNGSGKTGIIVNLNIKNSRVDGGIEIGSKKEQAQHKILSSTIRREAHSWPPLVATSPVVQGGALKQPQVVNQPLVGPFAQTPSGMTIVAPAPMEQPQTQVLSAAASASPVVQPAQAGMRAVKVEMPIAAFRAMQRKQEQQSAEFAADTQQMQGHIDDLAAMQLQTSKVRSKLSKSTSAEDKEIAKTEASVATAINTVNGILDEKS